MMRVRLTVLEPLYGHERSTYYIQFVNAHLKSVPLEKVAEITCTLTAVIYDYSKINV